MALQQSRATTAMHCKQPVLHEGGVLMHHCSWCPLHRHSQQKRTQAGGLKEAEVASWRGRQLPSIDLTINSIFRIPLPFSFAAHQGCATMTAVGSRAPSRRRPTAEGAEAPAPPLAGMTFASSMAPDSCCSASPRGTLPGRRFSICGRGNAADGGLKWMSGAKRAGAPCKARLCGRRKGFACSGRVHAVFLCF